MANKRIQDLVDVGSFDGTEEIPLDKGGITKKGSVNKIKTFLETALNTTFEVSSNKEDLTLTDSATKYPSSKAVMAHVLSQVTGTYDDVSDFNASTGSFPTSGSGVGGYVMRADCYPVTVAGTVTGVSMKIGDILKAKIDNPAQVAANWTVIRNGVSYVPEDSANKGVANGYAGLDAAKKLANDIIRTDFRMSQGYIFDGVNDYLTVAHNDKLNFGTDYFSIQVSAKITPSSKDEFIIWKRTSSAPIVGFYFRKTSANILRFVVSNNVEFFIDYAITQERVYNLFLIKTSDKLLMYDSGILVAQTTLTSAINVNCSDNLVVGNNISTTQPFTGKVSLVRLFNRALSQSDVTYYENSGRPDLCRLKYDDLITNYGELVTNGNYENGLIGYKTDEGGVVSTYELNTSNPISGTKDGKLAITSVGTSSTRPLVSFPVSLKSRKNYVFKFDSRTISGSPVFVGLYDGANTITLNKNLIGDDKTVAYFTSADRESLLTYFNGTNLFSVQLDNVSVKQTGCVLELLPQNALPDRWLESQNGLDAITFGSPAINTETPITDTQIVDNITNNIATGVTNRDYTLPAGYLVDSVCVKSTVSLTALQLVNVSTSETLLTGKTVSSTAGKHLPITADQSSPTTSTTLRLNATGNTGLGFNIVINIKKCL